MSIDELVKKVGVKQKLRLSFRANAPGVAMIEDKFAAFFGAFVRNARELPDFCMSVNGIIVELAKNSLHNPEVRAVMEYHLGDGGVIVTYTDHGGFYGQSGTAEKITGMVGLHRQFPDLKSARSGLVKLYDVADEIVLDVKRHVIACAKYGGLDVISPESYIRSSSPA